jgi:hypothetical protein
MPNGFDWLFQSNEPKEKKRIIDSTNDTKLGIAVCIYVSFSPQLLNFL